MHLKNFLKINVFVLFVAKSKTKQNIFSLGRFQDHFILFPG